MSIIQLLKLEYTKFKNNSVVKLLLLFYAILTPFVILMGKRFLVNAPPPLPRNNVFFEFPTVWDYQGFVGSWLVFFFLGFFALYIITTEVSNKTMRQNIITGMTRKEYFLGKLFTIITVALLGTLLYTLSCIAIGVIHTEGWNMSLLMDNNYAILRYFLMCMGYMSFALLIGLLVRKGGLSIFLYFAYILIIEAIIKWPILLNIFARTDSIPNKLINYLPMNTIEDLMPNPVLKLPGNFMKSNDIDFDILLSHSHATIFSIIYIALFIALAWWTFVRRDV